MKTIVLNSSNLVNNGLNNQFVYLFPNSINIKNSYISVASVAIYYSWFNISKALGNNSFSYTWYSTGTSTLFSATTTTASISLTTLTLTGSNIPTLTVGTLITGTGVTANTYITAILSTSTYTVNNSQTSSPTNYTSAVTTTNNITIDDGIYQVADLNNLLQYNMIKNGNYLTNSSGQNVYYAEFIVNPSRYAVQINTFTIPSSLPTGYTAPSGFTYPPTPLNPVLTIPPLSGATTGLGNLLGFKSGLTTSPLASTAITGTYVSTNTAGTISYISTTSPNIQPNSSLLFSSTGVDNQYSIPTSIIYSISPNVGVGSIISDKPPNYLWNKMIDGFYNQLTITILGTNLQPIQLNDPSTTIMLSIATADERGIK
jgi:hypothetical protein